MFVLLRIVALIVLLTSSIASTALHRVTMEEYEEEPFGNATWRYNNVGGLQIRVGFGERPVFCVRGVDGGEDELPEKRNALDDIDVNAVFERHRGVSGASGNAQNKKRVLAGKENEHHHEQKAKKKKCQTRGRKFRVTKMTKILSIFFVWSMRGEVRRQSQ